MSFFQRLKLVLDRSLSSARLFQVIWLLGLLLLSYGLFSVINEFKEDKIKPSSRIIELLMDPGVFASLPLLQDNNVQVDPQAIQLSQNENSTPTPQSQDARPRVFEFIITLFGAVIFTGLMISIISNMLEGRVSAFKAGLIRYKFSDHILILGADEMIINMIRAFSADPIIGKKDIVVLTNKSVEQLYSKLYSELNKSEMRNLTLLLGSRDSSEELKQVCAVDAYRIYIIGESDEVQHDAVNISCCEKLEKLCLHKKDPLRCFMVINNLSSYHVFQFQSKDDETNWQRELNSIAAKEQMQLDQASDAHHDVDLSKSPLRLTIINSLENWAQQVLVTRRYENIIYPAIDRDGITEDSPQRVHFVVVGMTQMALSMGTTVAHIAHYPNFREGCATTKTKITFIAPDIEQEMNFFKGHYSSLFDLSASSFVRFNQGQKELVYGDNSFAEFGDFLDVEWEFVDGGIETPEVRNLLNEWCDPTQNPNEILTIAVCNKNSTENIATALYLPDAIFKSQIPIFVYQPELGKVLELAHKTARYKNIYPFGMQHNCYDPSLKLRILRAQRINYIYSQQNNYTYMTHKSEELDELWYQLSFADKLSNLYSANSIPTKLRCLGLEKQYNPNSITAEKLSSNQIEKLARIEHNRWNIEKLLVGFRVMPNQVRQALSPKQLKIQKRKYFTHCDIRPYDDLADSSKKNDRIIVSLIFDIMQHVDLE